MRPTAGVHLLSSDGDAVRRALDDVDDSLLTFGLTPDDRVLTDLPPETATEYAEASPNAGDPGTTIAPELLAAARRDATADPLAYARLTGPTVLARVVREETPGHGAVPLQCDRREAGVLTAYTVYRYDEAAAEYVTVASADGLFEV